ncbi:MAG: roadblock/LC7 domain-containing protein [Candidatus Hermodarchaeia archaeon]|jgi:predicted regulator of Ras-like GTPase activity (Roadblock/LC7/MglB family)
MTEPELPEDPMEAIMQILREAEQSVEGIQGVAVVSTDGLPMASAVDTKMGEAELAALASSMLSIGSTAMDNLRKGELDSIYVKCDKGYILLRYSGPLAVVLFITEENARLGPLLLELKRTATRLEEMLGFG